MNLKSIKEVYKTLIARFEKHGIQVHNLIVAPDGCGFTMILLFDCGQLELDYTIWDAFSDMEAVIRHHEGLTGSFLFPVKDCVYSGRIIRETYGFRFYKEEDSEKFIKWVINEVKPKLTSL